MSDYLAESYDKALRENELLRSRLTEAEALLREWCACATNIGSGEAIAKVEQQFVQRCRDTLLRLADSAKPVCEACGGAGKAYLLHSRAERPCPMCQADQPPARDE